MGSLLLSRIADYVGRKWALITISSLEFTSLLILSTAKNINLYYITRFIQGLCLGSTAIVMPLFISEVTEDHNRGKFGTFHSFFMCLGNIYGYTMGSLFGIKWFTIICAIPLVISVPLFAIFVPESPYYLVSKGYRNSAKIAFEKFLMIKPNKAEKVLIQTVNTIHETSMKKSTFSFLLDPGTRRALFLICVLLIVQQASGLFAILAYLSTILSSSNIPLSENVSCILISCIQLFSNVLAATFIEKLGRKFLLLTSSVMVTIALLVLGLYFELLTSKYEFSRSASWLPIIGLVVLILGYGFGLGPVCFILSSEIFPQDFKTVAGSFSLFISGIACFILVYTFPIVRDLLGISWCFWILGVLCILGFIFIYCLISETKGKSFLDIQVMMGIQ